MTPEQTPTNIDTEQEQVPPDEKGGVIDVQRLGAWFIDYDFSQLVYRVRTNWKNSGFCQF